MNGHIYVKIKGGLGNQLFQFAYALKLKKLFPNKQIVIDYTYFNKKHIRSMELQKLSIKNVEWDNSKKFFYDISYYLYLFLVKIAGKLHKKVASIPPLEKRGYIYNYSKSKYNLPDNELKNYYLAGYFQSENEIRDVRDEMVDIITPINMTEYSKELLGLISKKRSIGISIRIGEDYKSLGWPVCSKAYYENGIKFLISNNYDAQLVIFSDNIDLVKNENWFKEFKRDMIFVENCSAVDGLFLLSKCDEFVIANSTFSWWGAYLSNSDCKRIVAPEMFYNGIKMRDSGLHIPNALYFDNSTGAIIDTD